MNKAIGIVIVVTALVCAAAGAGAWWWHQQGAGASTVQQAPALDMGQSRYVTLDKIVVMLQTQAESPSSNRYLSLDLVLRTDSLHEKAVKADLPMLKGVAVRTLSQLDVERAKGMSIDAWTDVLSADLMAAYADRPMLRHFDQVMVSRLIIE